MIELALSSAVQLTLALLMDHCLGEPNRWHPLSAFGRMARWIERAVYPDQSERSLSSFLCGLLALALTVIPTTIVVYFLIQIPGFGWILEVVLLYLVIGRFSLIQHAGYVSSALKSDDLTEARIKVGWIVSRQTDQLTPAEIIRATIESVLENGNDAVFGAIFWFLVAGAPGAVLYRMANTLDAMWGYKNTKYLYFGRAAARFDDLLNLIPGQLCALTYALFGHTRQAIRCWFSQAPAYKSFNGGSVMASGAASLGITLGGKATYHGQEVSGVQLGCGQEPELNDIDRSTALVTKGTILWALITLLFTACYYI
ncbi:adenosylcobinamide-phosphate synthase CbiB [Endozoicomonas ascidiicola]|uniref:adenosylcobinamide-phosphate synthase CbiB n=1 Tax=Endozoicomonas ascidiicola TaxID=1698521 RepID=UPI000ACFC653|nr:adenosylcobinamide-phosphate synthase CbiB [Endozoicomonas ascidiicola]